MAALVLFLALGAGCSGTPQEPTVPCLGSGTVCAEMGTGYPSFRGEGGTPSEVALYWPIDLLFDAQGRFLVLDWNNQRVRRLDHDGRVRTILGTGFEDEITEGTTALETSLHHAYSMVYDAQGRLFLAGFHVPQIIRPDTDNRVRGVAGRAEAGYDGDGGPARDAALDSPCGVAVDPSGTTVYFADTFNHCIRRVDDQGIVTTVAGNGTSGYTGDGGPGTLATLHTPYRIRRDPRDGGLLICDTLNHAVRKLLPDGTIHTLAGTGSPGYSGDAGAATSAQLREPNDAQIGPDGLLYIADTANHRIRRVDSDGVIETVAGNGVRGDSGDGGPAREAAFDYPYAFTFSPEGDLLIADTYNSRIRRVHAPF